MGVQTLDGKGRFFHAEKAVVSVGSLTNLNLEEEREDTGKRSVDTSLALV